MILRARHLFVAWLAYGALQLALLGVAGVPGAGAELGARDARARSESHAVSLGKRTLASELGDHRRAPTTPFAPSAQFRLDLLAPVGRDQAVGQPCTAETDDAVVLPPARAPPTLS